MFIFVILAHMRQFGLIHAAMYADLVIWKLKSKCIRGCYNILYKENWLNPIKKINYQWTRIAIIYRYWNYYNRKTSLRHFRSLVVCKTCCGHSDHFHLHQFSSCWFTGNTFNEPQNTFQYFYFHKFSQENYSNKKNRKFRKNVEGIFEKGK